MIVDSDSHKLKTPYGASILFFDFDKLLTRFMSPPPPSEEGGRGDIDAGGALGELGALSRPVTKSLLINSPFLSYAVS